VSGGGLTGVDRFIRSDALVQMEFVVGLYSSRAAMHQP